MAGVVIDVGGRLERVGHGQAPVACCIGAVMAMISVL